MNEKGETKTERKRGYEEGERGRGGLNRTVEERERGREMKKRVHMDTRQRVCTDRERDKPWLTVESEEWDWFSSSDG